MVEIIIFIVIVVSLLLMMYFTQNSKSRWAKIIKQSGDNAILVIIISACSIFIGPQLNQRFEEQRIRSEYVLDNLKNLKVDTLQFFNDVQKLSNNPLNAPYVQIEQDGLKLRYRLLEIESIFGKNAYTEEFQKSLTMVLSNIKDTPESRYKYLGRFILASKNLTIYLAKYAKVADKSIEFYKLAE